MGGASTNDSPEQVAAKDQSWSQDEDASWEERQGYFSEEVNMGERPEQNEQVKAGVVKLKIWPWDKILDKDLRTFKRDSLT